jgi:hypothetical protein
MKDASQLTEPVKIGPTRPQVGITYQLITTIPH